MVYRYRETDAVSGRGLAGNEKGRPEINPSGLPGEKIDCLLNYSCPGLHRLAVVSGRRESKNVPRCNRFLVVCASPGERLTGFPVDALREFTRRGERALEALSKHR